MGLDKSLKEEVLKKYQLHNRDTGSADVQIAILTETINEVEEQVKTGKDARQARLVLLKLVGQRRKLLDYLNSTDTKRYHSLIDRLGLKR